MRHLSDDSSGFRVERENPEKKGNSRSLKFAVVTCLLLFTGFNAFAVTKYWTGAVKEADGTYLWSRGANWLGGATPNGGDDIVFDTPGSFTVSDLPNPALNFNSIYIYQGTIVFQRGGNPQRTYAIGGNAGTDLIVSSGASLTFGQFVRFTLSADATADISGTLIIGQTRSLTLETGTVVSVSGTLFVNANATLTNNGNITCTGTINTTTSSIISVTSTGSLDINGGTLNNLATFTIDGTVTSSGAFSNTSTGRITVNSTGSLASSTGTFTNDGIISNAGALGIGTGTNTNTGSITNTASSSTVVINGKLTNSSSGSFDASQGLTDVYGTIVNPGTVTGTSTALVFHDGSLFQDVHNNGLIPTAAWSSASTCMVTGYTNYFGNPTGFATSFGQAFGNFIWNCPNQTNEIVLGGVISTIKGNLSIVSTGPSGTFSLGNTGSGSLTVGGDFTMNSGIFYLSGYSVRGAAVGRTMTVGGSFTMTGGTFNLSNSSVKSNTSSVIITGDFTHTGGTITESGSTTASGFVFSGNGTMQKYTGGGSFSNSINFSILSPAYVQMGTAVTDVMGNGSGGTFSIASGAKLGVTSAAGITTSGATGNIRVSGSRTYNTGANYIYNGTVAQVTGNGLTQTGHTPASVTIDNASGVTLSAATAISGLLTMANGTLDMANTNLTAGSLTGSGNITNNSGSAGDRTITVGGDNTTQAPYSGIISNGTATSVALVKNGTGCLTFTNENTYTGTTTINGGELRLNPAASSITFPSQVTLNGGTLGTSGINTGTSVTFGNVLALTAPSKISLDAVAHNLYFADSHLTSWGTATLEISGWRNTGGHIFFGGGSTGLSGAQLSQITFTGYPSGASILPSGEIVPPQTSVRIASTVPAWESWHTSQGSTDNIVYKFTVKTGGTKAVVSGLKISVGGSWHTGDVIVLKAWYSADSILFNSPQDVLLSTYTGPTPSSAITFPSWVNQAINAGTKAYFFITADISCSATPAATFYVNAVTPADVTVYGTVDGSTTAGGTQTIDHTILEDVQAGSASPGDTEAYLSWTNPASCFDYVMIVANVNTETTGTPNGDGSAYVANAVYGSGTAFPGGGYVVYKGAAEKLTVTGLIDGLTYYFTIFSHKGAEWGNGVTTSCIPIAAMAGDYKTAATGDWETLATWLRYNGSSWNTPTSGQGVPNNTSQRISILSGHTVTLKADRAVDQFTVNAGGQLNINSNITLTISDGTDAIDCTVNGKVYNKGDFTPYTYNKNKLVATSAITFGSGSVYQHDQNGGDITPATWDAASTCLVTGYTNTSGNIGGNGFNQQFGNFTWNCTGQTAEAYLGGVLTSLAGNLTINNTGTSTLSLGTSQPGNLSVAGNFVQTGGTFYVSGNGTNGNGALRTVSVAGNFDMSGGSLYLTNTTTNDAVISVKGNYTHTGGTITESGNSAGSGITFNGTGTEQLYTGGAAATVSNTVNFVVSSPAFLQMGYETSDYIPGGPTVKFTVLSGATLGVTSAAGITTSGAAGNVQVGGTRIYSTGANYIYNGLLAQNSGNGIGLNSPANITITNTSGVTLSSPVTMTGVLTVNDGSVLSLSGFNLGSPSGVKMYDGSSYATGNVISGSGLLTLNGPVTVTSAATGTNGATISCPVTIGSSSRSFNIADDGSDAVDLTISGSFAGAAALQKIGAGTLLLSGANTTTGNIQSREGIIRVGSTSALGTSSGNTEVFSGAELDLNGFTMSSPEPLLLNGTGISGGGALVNSSTTAASYSGTITLNSASSINTVGNIISTGIISGPNALTKIGAGTLTLSGVNTYTGLTTISEGTAVIGNASALGDISGGTTVTGGAALDINGITLSTAEPLTLNGTGISNGGAFINSSSTAVTYNGAITLASASSINTNGSITLGSAGISGGNDLTKIGAGTLSLGSGTATLGAMTIGAGALTSTSGIMNVSGNFTNNGTFNNNSGTVVFNGAIQTLGGSSASAFNNLTISSSASTTLGLNTSVAGDLNITSGTFDIAGYTCNRTAAGGTLTVANGATLKIGGTNTMPSNFTTHTLGSTGTVWYSGDAQTVWPESTPGYGNLTLSGTGTKMISSGSAVTVNTDLNTGNLLVIESASLTESGSLIVKGTSTGTLTYNRQLRSDLVNEDWQYISSPVSGNSNANTGKITTVYSWDEVHNAWPVVSLIGLVSGRGYNIDQDPSSDGKISFTGLVSSSVSIPATSPYSGIITGGELNYNSRPFADGTGHSGEARSLTNYGGGGWNLLGNPFTSAFNVASFISANSAQFDPNYEAVYLYDPSAGTSGTYYYIGNSTGWGTGLSQTDVQAGQGFFVVAMNDNSTFSFNNTMQEHAPTSAMLKSTKAESRWPGLRLRAKQNDVESYTALVFNIDMTLGVDPGYDVGLMSSYPAVEIYTTLPVSNGINYVQQALPSQGIDSIAIPLGVNCAAGGNVTFSAETEPLENCKYLLLDKLTGSVTDLSTSSYEATLPANTAGTGRFYLLTKADTKTDVTPVPGDPDLLSLKLWAAGNVVYVRGEVSSDAMATVYDMNGRILYENYLTEGSYNSFTVDNVKAGIYIVRITDGSKTLTKKVFFN